MKYYSIYRIEDINLDGPYQSRAFTKCGFIHVDMKHPIPTSYNETEPMKIFHDIFDSVHYDNRQHRVFGFRNKKQMLGWFTRSQIIKMHSEYDMKVYKYHIPHNKIIFGIKQVVFYRVECGNKLFDRKEIDINTL